MKNIKVSVIVPTYKPQEYLWECLDSLAIQTMRLNEFEVIIVLNGPKDSYEEKIKEYIRHHAEVSINYIYSEDAGVSNARNIAIDCAHGEFIAFIDDDDYVSSSYLQELYDKSDRDTIGLAYPYAFDDGNSNMQLKYSITDEYERCFAKAKQSYLRPKKFFSGPCMKMIHRDIIGERRFDKRLKNGEDSIFMFLISDKMKYVNFTSRNAIYYRRFRQNSATTSSKSIGEILDNCLMRFKENTRIFYSNTKRYSFQRYCMTILGLCHIIIHECIISKIMRS